MAYKIKNNAIRKVGEHSYSINVGKVKSDDPLAYSYGYVEGSEGKEISKQKNLAPAYIEGYKKGKEDREKSFAVEKQPEWELEPRYDSRASFYGKARVRKEDGKLILRSYDTDVAKIEDGKPTVYGLYSGTTTRHIKEFLKQNGYKAETSKQIIRDYAEDN